MIADTIAAFCLRWRVALLALIVCMTMLMSYFCWNIDISTNTSDLQPSGHPYIETNEQFKEAFGGANLVTIMIRVKQGDIFRREVLKVIHDLQTGLQFIDGVHQFQIISLASKKLKYVKASTEGVLAEPLMWPDLPKTDQEIEVLRKNVIANSLVYGNYVSRDLTAALITVDFIDRLVDYQKIYPQIRALVDRVSIPGIEVHLVGHPILMGMVIDYLPETMRIVLLITVVIALILLINTGTFRATLLPLTSAAITGIWALGTARLFDINFDPLGIVIVFLISARVVSHSVQLNLAFDQERESGNLDPRVAARLSLAKLLRPGLLGLATDAGAMLIVALTPIPLLQKAAIIGVLWLGGMVIATIVMIPVILSWSRSNHEHKFIDIGMSNAIDSMLKACNSLVTERRRAIAVITASVGGLLLSGIYASDVHIGDANPGSPILWPDSTYNKDDAAINERFPGSDRMFLVIESARENTMKRPDVLRNISRFQRFIEAQPQVGGTQSLADIIRPVNMILHEGNPRYFKVGNDNLENAEFLYIAMASSDPGDVDRFVDYKFRYGAVQMNFRDHKGDTIRTALQAIRDYEMQHPFDGAHFRLAGGLIGVLAAVNEVIFRDQLKSIALALVLLFVCCAVAYRSTQAGLFFLPTVLLSNTITFGYMSLTDVGLNINTLPVAALGIGIGVDYGFYIADRIKEGFENTGDLGDSIRFAMMNAGRGVVITALTMIASVVLWYFFSSLRFQAEMGLLIAMWMTVSALSALIVIPSMIFLFRPRFLVGTGA